MNGWPTLDRRAFAGGAAALLLAGNATKGMTMADAPRLFGMIGKIRSTPGKRTELLTHLAAGSRGMPGNRLYLIAEDRGDPDGLWVTEVWDSKEDHAASLKLPQVQEAIAKARPIIAGFETSVQITPVEGLR